MSKSDNVEFRIASLRQDKMIYAIESCALNLICLLIFFFSDRYFSGRFRDTINILSLLVAVAYTLFMGVGNTIRYMKILKLEKELT